MKKYIMSAADIMKRKDVEDLNEQELLAVARAYKTPEGNFGPFHNQPEQQYALRAFFRLEEMGYDIYS